MSRINVPSEVSTLAHSLAILGNTAERVCSGYTTKQSLEQLYADLGRGKGSIMKLRRVVRDMVAAETVREREEARVAAIYARNESRLKAAREAHITGERMAAGMGARLVVDPPARTEFGEARAA